MYCFDNINESYELPPMIFNPIIQTEVKNSLTVLMKFCRQKHSIARYLMEKC